MMNFTLEMPVSNEKDPLDCEADILSSENDEPRTSKKSWMLVSAGIFLLAMTTLTAHASMTQHSNHSEFRRLSSASSVEWQKPTDRNRPANETSSIPETSSSSNSTARFRGTFNGSLPLFSADILNGYQGDEVLFRRDLRNAALLFLNGIVRQNLQYGTYGEMTPVATTAEVAMPVPAPEPVGLLGGGTKEFTADTTTASSTSETSNSGGGVDNFATNNQEGAVDEGDLVKSDGNYGTYMRVYVCS
jgi:hypothetical protein